jgi:hypothetical protein
VNSIRRATILLTLLAVGGIFGHTGIARGIDAPPPAAPRLAVPDASALAKKEKLIRDVFGNYGTAPLAERSNIAGKMIAQAMETTDDPAARYALLKDAADLAAGAGDAATAVRCAILLAANFAPDGTELKLALLRRAVTAASAPPAAGAVANEAMMCAADAAAAGDFDLAARFMTYGQRAARAAKNLTLLVAVQSRAAEIRWLQQETEHAKAAKDKLRKDPADPDANYALGRHFCLVNGDWTRGMIGLSKGSNNSYKTAANADLANPATTEKQVAAGDLWWEIGEKEIAAAAQNAVRRRASYWYSRALMNHQFAGLSRALVEKRMAQVLPPNQGAEAAVELPAPPVAPAATGATPAADAPHRTPARQVVLFSNSDNSHALRLCKLIAGGDIRIVLPGEIATILSSPRGLGNAQILVWQDNSICDAPANAVTPETVATLRQFVEGGGDLLIFEQFRNTNLDLFEKAFGIRKHDQDGPFDIATLDPALSARASAAGLANDDIRHVRFIHGFDVPADSSVLIRNKNAIPIGAVVPRGKGRVIVLGGNVGTSDAVFDEVFFGHIYAIRSN